MNLLIASLWILVGLCSGGRTLPLQSKNQVGMSSDHFARMLDLSVNPVPDCYCTFFGLIYDYRCCIFPFVRVSVSTRLKCDVDPIVEWVDSVAISFGF
jgi:hypothetical protein